MLQDEYAIIVAIHLGVSSSVCCYSFVDNKVHIETIKSWPRQSTQETGLLTAVSYSDLYETFAGYGNAGASKNEIVVRDLPYLLIHRHPLNEIGLTHHVDDKKSIKITADYIRAIHSHVQKQLQLLKYKNMDKVRYCFTLQFPGSGDIYKENLVKAIQLAGIYVEGVDRKDKIEFVDAYTAIAKSLMKTSGEIVVKGCSNFIICDLDTTHSVIRSIKLVSAGRDLEVQDGAINETMYNLGEKEIDNRFEIYVSSLLENHPDHKQIGDDQLAKIKNEIVNYFIKNIKYTWDVASKKEIFVRVSSSSINTASYIQLDVDALKVKVFDPVIDDILQRVDRACKKDPPEHVFVCGKMSKLLYLQHRLQARYHGTITVVSNVNALAAEGAIYYGYEKKLSISRYAPIAMNNVQSINKKEDRSYHEFNYDSYSHIIGIDFGTNYSKWCVFSMKEQSYVDFDPSDAICPTLALYDERLQRQKYWGEEAFGKYYLHPGEPGRLLNRFKLFLDETKKSNFDEQVTIKVISGYLEALNTHILERMEAKYPNKERHHRFCLTVPIIWDDTLKTMMRGAALEAKLISRSDHPSRLMLVSEPEAAAAFYSDSSALDPWCAEPDKRIHTIICDAGGGTVDIASYEYFKDGKESSYFIEEVARSSGDVCGSSFLEDNYRTLFIKKCKEKKYVVDQYNIELIIKDFTFNIKTEFSNDSKPFRISVPTISNKTEIMVMEPEELKQQVFESVVSKVVSLVKKQLEMSKKQVDLIILTGGLGQSKFLKQKVDALASSSSKMLRVYQPKLYDLSVVKGAVKVAMNPNIIHQRISQQTYGLEVMTPYNSDKHSIVDQTQLQNGMFAQFRFDKFIDANTPVLLYEYFEKTYSIEYPHNAFLALYGITATKTNTHSTKHPDIKKLLRYLIETPKLKDVKEGEFIQLTVRIYFGQTEIKIDSFFENGTITRLSCPFAEKDEAKRLKLEESHHY